MEFAEALPALPPAVARHTLRTLIAALPPPADDTPEAKDDRDAVAIAAVAALGPVDALEAALAAQIIGADAHAKECLRLAVQPDLDPRQEREHRARAVSLTRLMQSGLRALERSRARREKAAAANASPQPPLGADDRCDAVAAPLSIAEQAELYATVHPRRAAEIRRLGGLPARCGYASPPPDLLQAIITGTGARLRALDVAKAA